MYQCTGEYLRSQNTTRFFQYPKSTSEEGAAVAWFCCLSMCILLAKFPPAGLLKSIWENKGDIIICYLLQTLSSLRSSGALMLSSSPHSFDHNGQWFLCFCVFTSEAFLCWHNCNLMITLANFCYLDYTKSLNKKISKSDSSLQLYSFVRQNYLLTLNAKVPTIKLGSLWSHPSTNETHFIIIFKLG